MQIRLYPFLLILVLSVHFIGSVNSVNAQGKESKWFVVDPKPIVINWDTNYYVSYAEELTARVYTSTKYTTNRYLNPSVGKNLLYTPNNNIILGVGATYSIFTLNIGLNFPFVNAVDTAKFGSSYYLDLQTHMYTKKVTLDLYAQFYEGFYLRNSANVLKDWPQSDTFYVRPDIITYNLGWNAQYIFNHRKFSYRAIYNQNEWQKKSAGSWVVGANMFFVTNVGDSALIPSNVDPPDLFNYKNFKRKDDLNIGISGGYYYTWVVTNHLFFSIGFAGGPSIGYTWFNINESLPMKYSGVELNFNGVFRSSIGYNSERLYIGAFYLNQFVVNNIPINSVWSNFSTGNFRIILAYRFQLKKPIKLFNVRYWKITNKEKDNKKKN